MNIENTSIENLLLIRQFRLDDARGVFVKTFHNTTMKAHGIDFHCKESIYSVSSKDVIRGMHFHHPPHQHAKIVFCTQGSILDVALDLRKNSATSGQYFSTELSFANNHALYIPAGFAHGFLTTTETATAFYFIDGEYASASDDGIRYDSFGFDWGVENPILSPRDLQFQTLENFNSPF